MTYTMPTFTFTHAALVTAAGKGGTEADLIRAAEAGVADLMSDGPDDPMEIFFHCFDYHGKLNMIMSPGNDGTMLVDVAETEESEPLESGPFKGVRVMMPKPFSG